MGIWMWIKCSPINYIYITIGESKDYVYGLITGLYGWISLTDLSCTYFIEMTLGRDMSRELILWLFIIFCRYNEGHFTGFRQILTGIVRSVSMAKRSRLALAKSRRRGVGWSRGTSNTTRETEMFSNWGIYNIKRVETTGRLQLTWGNYSTWIWW